ncbi:hypothetical protein SAMN04487969_102466 [Paenibacillus algorifonticola]|uniref:Uncharacterized protein n=1 Tax=Paenibacillus algorifonticola TaxID=684063 RepID=A0A1I2AFN9_9BACL|nr:hypothetical protein [Paenibacillus algorifonticola]SFE42736.1 hypothetical protein SAMN04487969_102466 [Paenibacillus algorifonticola]
MNRTVTNNNILVKVEIRSLHKTMIISLSEEFENKVVIALEAWEFADNKEIKVIFEDETFTWITCPQGAFIYRTYKKIAVDAPAG